MKCFAFFVLVQKKRLSKSKIRLTNKFKNIKLLYSCCFALWPLWLGATCVHLIFSICYPMHFAPFKKKPRKGCEAYDVGAWEGCGMRKGQPPFLRSIPYIGGWLPCASPYGLEQPPCFATLSPYIYIGGLEVKWALFFILQLF